MKSWVKSELLPQVCEKTIICLNGEMGSGKTEIVKIVCHQMGFDQAQSPTFGLANLYQSSNSKLLLYHIDLYRINSLEDLESTGFWDLLSESHSAFFIEWAQLIPDENWPWDWKRVQIDIEKNDLQERVVKLRFPQV